MNKSILYFTILMLIIGIASAGEISRVVSSTQVEKGGTFTVKYSTTESTPFFYSIKDIIDGGCTVSGGKSIVTTLTSPMTETGIITITAPNQDTNCYIAGDSKLGSASLVNFQTVKIVIGNGGTNQHVTTSDTSSNVTSENSSMMPIIIGVVIVIGAMFLFKKK